MTHNPVRPWRNIDRRSSRRIHVGPVPVGDGAPISVQTMTNTLAHTGRIRIAITRSTLGHVLVAHSDRGITGVLLGDDVAVLRADVQRRAPAATLVEGDD